MTSLRRRRRSPAVPLLAGAVLALAPITGLGADGGEAAVDRRRAAPASGVTAGVRSASDTVFVTLLHQNFPNPFPRTDLGLIETRIWFDLHRRSAVELGVFDLQGRPVKRLVPAPGCGPVELEPGLYGREDGPDPCVSTRWDGRDDAGRAVPAGVYVIRLRAAGDQHIRRAVYRPD